MATYLDDIALTPNAATDISLTEIRGIPHHDPNPPADRVHQYRSHDHPLQLGDPAHRRAGNGGSRRPVRLVVWPDPGPCHRHVRVLRPAVAAAELAGAALRP